jgi:hypothetical protein
MKSILDKSFVYVRSEKTDLRKTFARIRAEHKRISTERSEKVQPLRKAK